MILLPAMNSQLPQGLALIAMSEIVVGSLGIVFSLALFLTSVSDWSAILACFTLLWIMSGFAFLHQKQWAWKLGRVVSLVSFLGSILFFSLVQSFLFFFGPGLIFWPCAIVYLTRPRIKNLFARANMPSMAPTNHSER